MLVKGLARAFRRKRLLGAGGFTTIRPDDGRAGLRGVVPITVMIDAAYLKMHSNQLAVEKGGLETEKAPDVPGLLVFS